MIKIVVAGTRGFPGVQGGVETHCENLYPQLVKLGCEITVFTREPYVDINRDIYSGIRLIPLSCPRNKFLEAIVHTFKCVLKARSLSPDILHIHAVGPSLFVPLARVFGMKVVVTNHGPDYERKKWPLPAKVFLRFCERLGVTFANKIIAIAKNISDDLKRNYNKRSDVIPNGVDIPEVAEGVDCLKKFKLQKEKYILAVGRFVPEKGFDDLIDAFSKGEYDQWKLVIVGDSDHEDRYSRELKEKAGKIENVILTGFLSGQPLQEVYSHAGIFVIPSSHEGLPIVLLEAMSYGLSCIASDIPANKNVKLDANRFYKVGDVDSMSEKIQEYIDKPWSETDRNDQIAMIADEYNWSKIADQTLKVYRSVLN